VDGDRRPFGEPGVGASDEAATEGGAAAPEPSLVARQLGADAARDRGERDVSPASLDRVDAAGSTFGPGGPAAPEQAGVEAPGDDADLTGIDATDPGGASQR
jgi:hypothetical protein